MNGRHPAADVAEAIADRLAHPDTVRDGWEPHPWLRQSLAHGAPGIALLHIELAASGRRPWQRVHDWLAFAAGAPITTGPGSHLHHGAPALAHTLACAAASAPGSVNERALADLDHAIARDVRRRLVDARARLDRGRLPTLAEFDAIRGLTGLGSYLLRRRPGGQEIRDVLSYLVRLTHPVEVDGDALPGWWVLTDPGGRLSDRFPGGHGNIGVAHGIGGPLALLSLAALTQVTVDGQIAAITAICAWLDEWSSPTGQAWPYWVTRSQLRDGHRSDRDGRRPSWCYGTAGLARAQQLAALATGDGRRRDAAERELARALGDRRQRAAIVDASLCHGNAGIAHVAARIADDATAEAAAGLRALLPGLLDTVHMGGSDPARTADRLLNPGGCGPGLLEGAVGVALAARSPATGAQPASGWDTCLLIA